MFGSAPGEKMRKAFNYSANLANLNQFHLTESDCEVAGNSYADLFVLFVNSNRDIVIVID